MSIIKWFTVDPARTTQFLKRAATGLAVIFAFWLGLTLGSGGTQTQTATEPSTSTNTNTSTTEPGVTLIQVDAVKDVAVPFTEAWLKAPDYSNNNAWINDMKPYATPAMIITLRSANRDHIPTGPNKKPLTVTKTKIGETIGDTAQIDIITSDKKQLTITVKDTPDGTLVTDLKRN